MSLLVTKFFAPPLRAEHVVRPGLVERLEQNLGTALTLISAPAGFGKTSLVAEWLSRSKVPTAWLSLDENDNQVTTFVQYLVASLSRLDNTLGRSALALVNANPDIYLEDIITELINDIAELEQGFVLVIDDYHLIENTAIDTALSFFVENSPPNLHIILTSRIDPTLPLSRWRAGGLMHELRMEALRFDKADVASYLLKVQLDLSEGDIQTLTEKTEGWAAGLQLAALSLKRSTDTEALVHAFKGSDRFVLDYLTDEVLKTLPEDVYDFLLKTAVLERLSASLCTEMTGQAADSVLQELDAANLFLIPLDNERQWYRYHHLFADLLRHRLKGHLSQAEVAALHERASEWFFKADFLREAMVHAYEAEAFDLAVTHLEASIFELTRRGQLAELLTLMAPLPEDILNSRPRLLHGAAKANTFLHRHEKVEALLARAEQGLSKNDPLHRDVQATRAFSLAASDIRANILNWRDLLEPLDETDANYCIFHLLIGLASYLLAETEEAERACLVAIRAAKESSNIFAAIAAQFTRTWIARSRGQLRKVEAYLRDILDLAHSEEGQASPGIVYAHLVQAELATERNDLNGARASLDKATELADKIGDRSIIASARIARARLYSAQGDFASAKEAMEGYLAMPQSDGWEQHFHSLVSFEQAYFLIKVGNTSKAKRHFDALSALPASELGMIKEAKLLNQARLELAQNRLAEAGKALTDLISLCDTRGHNGTKLKALVLKAIVGSRQKNTGAPDYLQEALRLAETEGYLRIFLDEAEALEGLFQILNKRRALSPYGQRILQTLHASGPLTPLSVEDLSDAEGKVLRLLAARMTYKEMAKELGVSVNTIKTHVQNIYSKLGVHSRSQVIKKIQQLRR